MAVLAAGGVLVGLAGAQVALGISGAIPLAIALAGLALLGRRERVAVGRPAYAHDTP
jgi:hypothetical protein